jgi:hypothetical protein
MLLAVCLGSGTPQESDFGRRAPLGESFARGRLAVWQNRLNLKDWKISLVMSHPIDLREKTFGNVRWDADKKTAVIRVLDASEYQLPFRATLNDMEFTIVHELIHLEFASLPRNEASRGDEEFSINHIATALLQRDRKD